MGQTVVRDDLRETILDATSRLFQRYGYKKTTVEDIAQEGGICRGTIYLHFKSKEDIALSLTERKFNRLLAELRHIAAGPEPPVNRLRQMLLARVLVRFDFAQPYTQSLDELLAALRVPFMAQRERQHNAEAELFAAVLTEGAAAGELCYPDASSTAGLLLLATNALLPYSLSTQQLGRRDEIETKTLALTRLLLEGLQCRK